MVGNGIRIALTAGLALAASGPAFAAGAPLKVRALALVEAKSPQWPAVPDDAVIDKGRLGASKRAFLAPARGIPAGSAGARKALAAATKGLKPGDRALAARVLAAIEEWSVKALVEEPGPASCPDRWRDGGAVLKSGKGNGFELARALVAMLRTAGIPARPAFNGSPVVFIHLTPVKDPAFWTVWDPVRPSGSIRQLPLLWVPLRAGDVVPVATEPKVGGCNPVIEGRRYATREEAAAAFGAARQSGGFGTGEAVPLPAGLSSWWEVWAIGADYDSVDPQRALTVTVPLPFSKDSGSGTREQAAWVSDPARSVTAGRPQSETDQELGGLFLSLKMKVGAAGGPAVPGSGGPKRAVPDPGAAAGTPVPAPEGLPSGTGTPVPAPEGLPSGTGTPVPAR
jgi:hypothetical protein